MNKQKVLEDLQKFARDISEKESMLRENNEKRLAEFLTVWRLMNFRFQNLIEKTDEDKIKSELESMEIDLISNMEFFFNHHVETLSDLYGAALDGFYKMKKLITAYLP